VATWRVGDTGHVWRLAWTNTLTRPDFRELIPYDGAQVNAQLQSVGLLGLTARDDEFDFGNPDLTEQSSMNWDFGWEYYFGTNRRNAITATYFYKDLGDFLQENSVERDVEVLIDPTDPSLGTEIVTEDANFWSNGSSRRINGFEFTGYFNIGDLTTISWFDGLSIVPNYTYITGEQTDPIYDQDALNNNGELVQIGEVKSDNLTNQAEHIANVQFFYEWNRLNVRLSYNYISEIQRTPSTAAISDTTFDTSQSLWDLSLQYTLVKDPNMRLFLEVDNLTDEAQDERYIGPNSGLFTTSYELVGRRYVFGLRGSF
jgi:TonB-dependent receptor